MKTVLAAAMALLLAGPAAAVTPPITKTEARQAPPAIVAKHVTDQLAETLIITPDASAQAPRHRLAGLWYWLPSHASDSPGLCTATEVHFQFTPVDDNDQGADTPVRLSDLDTRHVYHFLTLPTQADATYFQSPGERREGDAACSAWHPGDDDSGFTVENEGQATRGVYALLQVLKKIDAPDGGIALTCDGEVEAACRGEIAALKPEELISLDDCGNEDDAPYGCLSVDIGNKGLTIHVDGDDQPVRVTALELVILADYRAE